MKQVPTVSVSAESIMKNPTFARGLNEVRRGLPFELVRRRWKIRSGGLELRTGPLVRLRRPGRYAAFSLPRKT